MRKKSSKWAQAMIVAAVGGVGLSEQVMAQTFDWSGTTMTGVGTNVYNWPLADNWSGTGVPNGAGVVANIIAPNISATSTIQLQQGITIGSMTLGDSDGSNAYVIASGSNGTQTLTFEASPSTSSAALTLGSVGTATNSISSLIRLNSDLNISAPGQQKITTDGAFDVNGKTIVVTGGTLNQTTWTVNANLTGTGTIIYNGLGGINIVGTKSFTGKVVLNRGSNASSNGGTMTATSGSIANVSELEINGFITSNSSPQGGMFHSGNSADQGTNPGQRAPTGKIVLNGGQLELVGQTPIPDTTTPWRRGEEYVRDEVNTIVFNSGYNVYLGGFSNETAGTQLVTQTVTRNNRATGYLRATGLGNGTGDLTWTAANLDTNPGLYLRGGGGAEGSNTISIIPWLVANNSGTNGGAPNQFATYVGGGVGFKQISGTEVSSSLSAGATVNVGTTALTTTNDVTVNSLRYSSSSASNITNNQTTGSNRTITVASGGVIFGSSGGVIGTPGSVRAGTLSFGTAEGVIWSQSANANTIGSVLAGSGGITKAGTGTLTLAGQNTYTGPTVVSGGTLRVGDGSFASYLASKWDDEVIVANGAVLQISSANAIANGNTLILEAYGLHNGIVRIDTGLTETIGGLKLNGTYLAIGTYSGTEGMATFWRPDLFQGSGVLNVTAVPEPASLSVLGLGAIGLLRRRRR